MKSILVPVDYSDASNNALEYALSLAEKTGASLTLLHIYHLPLPQGEMPLMLMSPAERVKTNHDRMHELAQAIRTRRENKVHVSSVVREGFAAEEIAGVALEIGTDLIVMGTRGSTSAAAILFGSVTTAVINKSAVPVLSVPEEVRFHPVRRMMLAFDYSAAPGEKLKQFLKQLATWFAAELQVVNVVDDRTIPDMEQAKAGIGLEHALDRIAHRLYYPAGSDVSEVLNKFVAEHQPDWVIMIPHDYDFITGIFHKSITKRAAFSTKIPLLTIHN